MQAQLALYLGILFYSAIVSWWLIVYDQGVLTTAIVLLGVPIVFWWHELHPTRLFVTAAAAIALATAVLFETIAHTSGLWLSVSPLEWRLFGLFPPEVLLYNIVLYFYIVFFHEFLVDDKRMYKAVLDRKKQWLLTFILGASFSIVFLVLVSGQFIIPYSFTMLLVGLILAIAGAAAFSHVSPWHVLEKALLTAALMLPVMVLLEAVAIMNVHTVFANPAQYLYSLEILGELVPVEKVLYMVLAPIWIVTVYELYFDDAQ